MEVIQHIRDIQLDEWIEFKDILDNRPHIIKYMNHRRCDYGTTVYCFDSIDIKKLFNYEFLDFIAKIILSNDYLYTQFVKEKQFDKLEKFSNWWHLNKYIFTTMDNITNAIPAKNKTHASFVEGYGLWIDKKHVYVFVNDGDRYIYYHSWGIID